MIDDNVPNISMSNNAIRNARAAKMEACIGVFDSDDNLGKRMLVILCGIFPRSNTRVRLS